MSNFNIYDRNKQSVYCVYRNVFTAHNFTDMISNFIIVTIAIITVFF